MSDETDPKDEALTAVVEEMLAMADEIEAQAQAWAAALERLGEERAARLRRKAFRMRLRRRKSNAGPSCAEGTASPAKPATRSRKVEPHLG